MIDFAECATCAAKPGSPTLCSSCLKNRALEGHTRKLIVILDAVRTMRDHQREWFGGDKRAERLQASRKAEREVDALIKRLDEEAAPSPQGRLF